MEVAIWERRLATSRPRLSEGRVLRDENGYRVMDTEWHRITCFNGLGKTVAEHCEKGMKVLVQGRIHYTVNRQAKLTPYRRAVLTPPLGVEIRA